MKKLLIFAAIFVSLAILVLGIYLTISLLTIDAGNKQSEAILTTQEKSDIEDYAAENYPDFSAQYDTKTKRLRLSKTTAFSLESAATIYDDTSTYLTQAQIFALEISAVCGEPELTVELCYISKDGEAMLSVASDGTIIEHWK